jgi:hypothetical protein
LKELSGHARMSLTPPRRPPPGLVVAAFFPSAELSKSHHAATRHPEPMKMMAQAGRDPGLVTIERGRSQPEPSYSPNSSTCLRPPLIQRHTAPPLRRSFRQRSLGPSPNGCHECDGHDDWSFARFVRGPDGSGGLADSSVICFVSGADGSGAGVADLPLLPLPGSFGGATLRVVPGSRAARAAVVTLVGVLHLRIAPDGARFPATAVTSRMK